MPSLRCSIFSAFKKKKKPKHNTASNKRHHRPTPSRYEEESDGMEYDPNMKKGLLMASSDMNSSSNTAGGSATSSGGGATNRTKSSGYTNRSALSLGLGNNQGVIRDDDSSIPTIDPDYNPASSDFSLSDAGGSYGGGTIGSQSHSLATSAFGSTARSAAFGASSLAGGDSIERRLYNDAYFRENNAMSPTSRMMMQQSPQHQMRDVMLEIYAPSGKLGVVIDTPSSANTPVVHAIKDTCPIRNEIMVGDKLVAVDDEDVREMTATQVSKLISRKSGQGRRKLTIIRSVRGGGGEGVFDKNRRGDPRQFGMMQY
eukprot:scaffold1211_cov195-Alexandrium_tamarense.AAC.20